MNARANERKTHFQNSSHVYRSAVCDADGFPRNDVTSKNFGWSVLHVLGAGFSCYSSVLCARGRSVICTAIQFSVDWNSIKRREQQEASEHSPSGKSARGTSLHCLRWLAISDRCSVAVLPVGFIYFITFSSSSLSVCLHGLTSHCDVCYENTFTKCTSSAAAHSLPSSHVRSDKKRMPIVSHFWVYIASTS